jgi:signal transduction histidine kinase
MGREAKSVLLDRWQRYWSWLFYGLLLLATGLAVADVDSDRRRVAIVVLAAGLAVSYWRAVARSGRFAQGGGLHALVTWAVAATLWASLLVLHGLFALLMFSAYHLACSTPMPVRRALPGIAAVSVILVATESVRQGGVDPLELVFYGAVTLALGLFIAFMQAIHEQSEERRRLISELEAARGELAESERRAGTLAERQRLAREIHDTLAQGFASIVTLYEAARAELTARPEVALRRLEEVGRTARSSLAEARRVVWALRPDALVEGTLADALDGLVRDFRSETGLDAASRVTGETRSVATEAEATLLRVAQEALANVRKHARASRVALTLTYLDDALLLDVRDDGAGFEPELADRDRDGWQAGGFGLTGMRERLEQRGGSLTIESEPGAGTTIAAALPDVPAGPANDEPRRRAKSAVR